ncbi:MAG TPA: universal stress protein [Thermopetrobacter sp.]|nr:universal stress protein [Thermopetrobacter sp.]
MSLRRILLASHGTKGARAAERAALNKAARAGAEIVHLYVVPDFWAGMKGDDWLNSPTARNAFGDYLEKELTREAEAEIDRLNKAAKERGVHLTTHVLNGDPADCLLRLSADCAPGLVIIGQPRPKGETGYNSRMKPEPLLRALACPLLVVPRAS